MGSITPFGKIVILHVMLKELTTTCVTYLQSIYLCLNNSTTQILLIGVYSHIILCLLLRLTQLLCSQTLILIDKKVS